MADRALCRPASTLSNLVPTCLLFFKGRAMVSFRDVVALFGVPLIVMFKLSESVIEVFKLLYSFVSSCSNESNKGVINV